MRTKHAAWRRNFLFAMAVLAGPGCETDDNVDSGGIAGYFENNPYTSLERLEGYEYLRITPASAEVTFVGQTVLFQVDGGTPPYEWSVGLPGVGSVGSVRENEAVYTAGAIAANNVLVFDVAGRSGVAAINGGIETETLAVNADPDTLAVDGDRTAVNVSGGVPPYRWTVLDGDLGSIDRSSGESVVYTRLRSGDNSVRVTDSEGSTGAVVIQQPASGGALTASASPSSLPNNGDRATLTASGGTPPYRWYLQDAALGSLDTDGGSSVTYTRNRPGDNSVRVTDANDDTVTVLIQQP